MVAVGQTLVVLTRNIDLSVGSIVGFTAYFVGTQLANHNEMWPLAAVLMAIGVGALLGAVNGAAGGLRTCAGHHHHAGHAGHLSHAAGRDFRRQDGDDPIAAHSGWWICPVSTSSPSANWTFDCWWWWRWSW